MQLGQWVRHYLVYGIGVVLMSFLPSLLIPIYTHRIAPSDYGVLELLNRSADALILAISFGLRATLLTFYQMAREEPERRRGVYSTALQFATTAGLVVVAGLALFAGRLSGVLFGSRSYMAAVILILAATYFELLFQLSALYLQSEMRSGIYVTVHVSRLLFAILLNLVLVYWWRWGLIGILLAMVLHSGIFALWMLVYMFRNTGFVFQATLLWEMLRFGLPLVPASLAGFVLNNGDRYFLNAYATRADVGIYGLGYALGMASMSLVLQPFGKIWSTTMVDISRRPDGPRALGNIAFYLLAVCAFSTLGLSLLGPYAVRLLAARPYWEAYRVIPVVGAAYIFYAWTVVMDASFYVTKRTVFKPIILSLSSAVILLLYWSLIPRFGMMGAAWATLGGFAASAALTAAFSQRVYHIDYPLGRIILLLALAWVLYEVGSFLPVAPILAGSVGRVAVTLAFPIILWAGGFLTPGERRALAEYWKGLRSRLPIPVRS